MPTHVLRRALASAALVTAIVFLATAAHAAEPLAVTFPSRHTDKATITGYLWRPAAATDARPRPAIVAMHGCGGLFTPSGSRVSSRHLDWAERFAAAGYVALLPDSFGSRGLGSICETRKRAIQPRDRASDAVAAADWLATQPDIDTGRIAILGWSHGGSTTLWSTSGDLAPKAADWRVAIAFYPGCRVPAESAIWKPRLTIDILIGDADDWTPPEPCRLLRDSGAARLIEYPGAYHGFDAPRSPIRVRTGLAFTAKGDGVAHSGTDPKAREAAIVDVMRILAEAFK